MANASKVRNRSLERSIGEATALLRALASESRLLILCQLGDAELSVGAIQERVGISQSSISQHLAVLRDLGLVATRREAQTIFYRIADPAAEMIIAVLAEIFCPEEKDADRRAHSAPRARRNAQAPKRDAHRHTRSR